MGWNLLKQLRGEETIEVRRTRFFRLGKLVATGFLVGGLIGGTQTYWAVRSGEVWRDAQGEVISESAMFEQCAVFFGFAAFGLVLFVVLRKWSQRY
jgi:hypothetical protein